MSGDSNGSSGRPAPDDDPRRAAIEESWRRCRAIGLSRDALPRSCPVDPAFYEYRDAHPMNDIQLLLADTVGDETVGSDSFVFITDERAGGLWVSDRDGYEAHTAADTLIVLLSEESAGTTAPALALLHGTEMQVDGPEHYLRVLDKWWTAATPVRDETTGRVIGTVGVSTVGDRTTAQPISLVALRSIMRLIENERRRGDAAVSVGVPTRPVGGGPRVITCGAGAPRIVLADGTDHPLTRRQCEILVLLAWHSSGLSADRLAVALSENALDPVTVRAEVSRLRTAVGPDLLRSRPYRLDPSVGCDLVDVAADAAGGRVREAVDALSDGCALAHSTAPGVVEVVDEIVSDIGSAALASDDVATLASWTSSTWGRHDDAAWRRLASLTDDPRTALRARGRASIIDRRHNGS